MGIGIVIIFWIIILIFISLILTPFIMGNGFLNTFKKIFMTLLVFSIIFLTFNKIVNHFTGKSTGSFGDTGYYEILNGYTFEWIDDIDNGQLVYGNKLVATNAKTFSETFKFMIKDNLLILEKSTKPNQVVVVDTIKREEKVKPKKWLLENNISEQNLETLFTYHEKEFTIIEKILTAILSCVIALLGTIIFIRKYYKKVGSDFE